MSAATPLSAYGRVPAVLVFVDVDGTLLPFGGPSDVPPTDGNPLTHRIDRAQGDRLANLPAQLIWATTWMDDANDTLAPLLGWPRLPVLEAPEPSSVDDWFGLHWKTRAIVTWAAGRAFAWLDDEITGADVDWVGEHHGGPSLLLKVDGRTGLSEGNLRRLELWATDHAARR